MGLTLYGRFCCSFSTQQLLKNGGVWENSATNNHIWASCVRAHNGWGGLRDGAHVQVMVLWLAIVRADSGGDVHICKLLPCVWSGYVRIRCRRWGARVFFVKKNCSSNRHVDCYSVAQQQQPTTHLLLLYYHCSNIFEATSRLVIAT
jgi:hypothetical protein